MLTCNEQIIGERNRNSTTLLASNASALIPIVEIEIIESYEYQLGDVPSTLKLICHFAAEMWVQKYQHVIQHRFVV